MTSASGGGDRNRTRAKTARFVGTHRLHVFIEHIERVQRETLERVDSHQDRANIPTVGFACESAVCVVCGICVRRVRVVVEVSTSYV